MKTIIFTIILVLFTVSMANAQSPNESFWLGTFEHEDGGGKVLNQLKVKRDAGNLTAVYRGVVTAQLVEYFSMTVEVKESTAFFYYDQCLSKEGDTDFDGYDPSPCSENTNKKGDLMFKLVKSIGKTKNPKILTYSGKFEDVEREDNIFFEKVK